MGAFRARRRADRVVTDPPPTEVVLGRDPRGDELAASEGGGVPVGLVSRSLFGGCGAPFVGRAVGARRIPRCFLLTRFLWWIVGCDGGQGSTNHVRVAERRSDPITVIARIRAMTAPGAPAGEKYMNATSVRLRLASPRANG
jgi:hypothetical protein